MDSERPPSVVSPGRAARRQTSPGQLRAPFGGVNETAELVLDLLGRTALVAPDVLALVRGRTT